MKKIIILGFLTLFISSCGGIKSSLQGVSNDAFLEFIGNQSKYSDGVNVVIDNNTPFNAQVKKPNYKGFRKKVYALSKGTHDIIVSYNNNIILKQRIFISINETKKIVLP